MMWNPYSVSTGPVIVPRFMLNTASSNALTIEPRAK
jgi:hypothetical protein